MATRGGRQSSSRYTSWQLLRTFSAKFVLEIMGGGGAVWGFSEACGLRTQDNVWLWRPLALMTALVFALRWLWQLQDAVMLTDNSHGHFMSKQSSMSSTTGIQMAAMEDNDLALEEETRMSSEITALTTHATSSKGQAATKHLLVTSPLAPPHQESFSGRSVTS
jgi:hypothetical protein